MTDPIVCRCEGITLSQVRRVLDEWDVTDLTEARILTRVGLGECQGRVCLSLLARVLAERTGRPLADLVPPRGRDPVRLVPAPEVSASDD